ncbi:Uncharacterised protein [BD1-7 clade bacterium]|uniref:Cytochrome c domain-containing protein n=1 Tax=BD1-7 clade bacterium TaxID=2029982 RepID=A0A5S9PW78_9GAMM|nr:Uncharacterised protein [BD1-7 clade bacterium]
MLKLRLNSVTKWMLAPALAGVLATPALAADAGSIEYQEYCAACHGADGKGMGPKAQAENLKPIDLTMLSKDNGGYFPYSRIRSLLDGRVEKGKVRPHSDKGMPVWGRVFMAENPGSTAGDVMHQEAVVKVRILNLVDYLVSIQEK